jgi:phage RecT family recombinase
MTTELAQAVQSAAPTTKPKNLQEYVELKKYEIQAALPPGQSVDRFLRICFRCLGDNPKLLQVANNNPRSFITAVIEVAASGLDPSISNEVSLVPFGSKIVKMDGYKGLMKLAEEAAQQLGKPLKVLTADAIFEHDRYSVRRGSNTEVIHDPPPFGQSRGDIIGFVSVAVDLHGRINFVEMTRGDMENHYQRYYGAKDKKGSAFALIKGEIRNFERYGCKTVLRLNIHRNLPMTAKLSRAIDYDIKVEQGIDPSPENETPMIDTELTDEEKNEILEAEHNGN